MVELAELARIAHLAGAAILEIYRGAIAVELKDDKSPLTAADLAAHQIIQRELAVLTPSIPQLSEEGAHLALEQRAAWSTFWLIDPLDGTKEFIKRNDEFTVNIALITHGEPQLSVVYAPALDQMLLARRDGGLWQRQGNELVTIEATTRDSSAPLRVACSRSHPDARLQEWLAKIGPNLLAPAGSSLKFMAIARGEADVYPRFGPTSQWDTAAGQLLVEAAGGRVLDGHGVPLNYQQRASLLNPDFFAFGASVLPDFQFD